MLSGALGNNEDFRLEQPVEDQKPSAASWLVKTNIGLYVSFPRSMLFKGSLFLLQSVKRFLRDHSLAYITGS